ncbi:MAG TPA: Smr/MutS family protein, partial [Vicinamibacteria bacterium]|nr:Smr/MutS family protein [Vicinamibacteria bacterium]
TPGVATASFGYHPDTYEPTYRLTLGAPGRSLALEMAERLGLPAEVVRDARSRRDDKEQQAEALLARLEKEKAEIEREKARIEGTRAEAEGARARALIAEREIQARKRKEVELFARELRRRGEEAERKAAEAIRAAVAKVEAGQGRGAPRLRSEAVAAIRDARDAVLKDPELELPEEQEVPAQALGVGMRVRVKAMGLSGEVMALQGDAAEVAVSGKRLRVPRAELVALSNPRPAGGRAAVVVAPAPTKSVPAEVNLIGLTVEEASARVEKVLDDAALSDRREIRLVHGFGEGKLRKAVARTLEGHPLVSSWRLGGPSEGGGGATVVELKD